MSALDEAPTTSCAACVWNLCAVHCTNLQRCGGNWRQDDWSMKTANSCIPVLKEGMSKESFGRLKTLCLCKYAQHQASLRDA